MPLGLDMNDAGYARGGSGIDSAGPGEEPLDTNTAGEEGEWHFHVFGETVGLFALDVRQGSAGLKVLLCVCVIGNVHETRASKKRYDMRPRRAF